MDALVLLLAPYAPHIAEELWSRLGHKETLAYESWPAADPALAKAETVILAVQINGKVRTRITLNADEEQDKVLAAALSDERVQQYVTGKTIKKTLVVPNKLVSLVVA